ncbi:diguanylate cyclase [Thiohalophilus sp.]|uniref:GGDEF domain-containing protein n=1 Tax=Thiohalophilus sp. TaxID=3028392 RepID=UPI002ACE8950|nr:diguanylate cyclase [Thiohalophilus sp.]MDZ7661346.1 diguanylate cyclase [Thiohalophilus sp.]MDZ7803085.1 diguanylate cyclase [Thiohalophilus sp.]
MANETGKSSREADHWKKKYYDSLDELDERQREWAQLEKQLRLLVSRLSLIAETDDAQLGKQLEKLRGQIRDSSDLSRLESLFSDINTAIGRLPERTGNKEGQSNPAHALQLLLDELPIPEDLARQEKYVRKKLARVAGVSELSDAVKILAELLSLTIEQGLPPGAAQSKGSAEAKEDRTGLLSSLFRRGAREKTDTADAPQRQQPVSIEVDSGQPEADVTKSEIVTDDEGIACALAGEILIQLLERIDFSDDLAVESELVRKKLEPCEDVATLTRGLDDTVKLIADLQSRVRSEKQDLENFLLQLTDRLQELDKDIQQTARLRDAALSESREMNQMVNSQVSSIEQTVDEALDLDSLKTAIQSRVVIIRNHVDRFLEQEEGRGGESHEIIQRLENQLRATEAESDKLRQQVKKAQNKAETDALTGIPNRMAYDRRLEEEIARHRRYNTDFVLMLWDIDHFKEINDTYGHAAGDKVLKVIAGVMQQQLRETDFLARYGGEEFAIILVESDIAAAKVVGEKLRQAIEALEFHFRGSRVLVTASCGLARAEEGDAEQLFERADNALYSAKDKGRNRIESAEA